MNSSQHFHASFATFATFASRVVFRVGRRFDVSPPPVDHPFAGRPRVMVVDDNAVNRLNLERLLWRKGIKPMHAADGAEAVALACSQHFDLILMDIQMPILDGLTASVQIRRHEYAQGQPNAPIVAYTAGAVADDEETLRACGIDDSLEKPCTADSLEHCLLRWCTDASRHVRSAWRLTEAV